MDTHLNKIKYDIDMPTEIVESFARFLVPEIRKFYESEEGQAYYKNWLKQHPEEQ